MTLSDIIVIVIFVIILLIIIYFNIAYYFGENENFVTYDLKQIDEPIKNVKVAINEMKFPYDNNVVEYGDYVCVKKSTNQIKFDDQIKLNNTCPNKSLNELHKFGKNILQPNQVCSQASSNTNDENFARERLEIDDPAKYYQRMFSKVPMDFDDGKYMGYNYYTFPKYGGIRNIGQIPLEKTVDYPIGANN